METAWDTGAEESAFRFIERAPPEGDLMDKRRYVRSFGL